MSRNSGQLHRMFGRFFKERQIYHRSDGVVHFISMSTKTQVALVVMAVSALCWFAYATVNVVFKEQIILSIDKEKRLMSNNHSRDQVASKRAYDEINEQYFLLERNAKAAIDELAGRHQILSSASTRKIQVDDGLTGLSEQLSKAGAPDGTKPKNGNRIMVDVQPGEPTPRQSRIRKLQKTAQKEASNARIKIPRNRDNRGAANSLETATAQLYTEQLLLLAELEEAAGKEADELRYILNATGLSAERFLTAPKIVNSAFAQGGPFVDIANLDTASPFFIKKVNRTMNVLEELESLRAVVERIPLSSPSTSIRYMTSRFGLRKDPFNGRPAQHNGLDFHAAVSSPVRATALGVIKYAGRRGGYGRVVEIDHGNGFITRYAHMRRISVKKGQKVKLHDKVGELGSSGRSTGPHIHYEILYKGVPQNPQRFIEAGRYVFES